jgi:hypothetical protein
LIAAPMPAVEPLAAHDAADPDAATDHRLPCPCCGGRMIIIEVFARGGAPRGPPSGAGIRIRYGEYSCPLWQPPFAGTACSRRRACVIPASASAGTAPRASSSCVAYRGGIGARHSSSRPYRGGMTARILAIV